ncbi:MAG: zinc ABC transporter substrate-binding protein [Bacteroidota bacterium]|nr:zinc ABC transporter substrate-binding protein [Bacteroidota bacterium]
MKKYTLWLAALALAVVSCGPRTTSGGDGMTVTVTIPPFAWFVEQIGGDDFKVNVLLPPGADHHIWEPLPAQISSLSGSAAFIMNGQLSFEHAWMDRFRQVNPGMKVLDLSTNIQLIGSEGLRSESLRSESLRSESLKSEGLRSESLRSESLKSESLKSEGLGSEGSDDHGHIQGATDPGEEDHAHLQGGPEPVDDDHAHNHGGPDPHYWMSPVAARIMARDVCDFLAEINPASAEKYDANLLAVNRKITEVDSTVRAALGDDPHRTVLIYHPALAYMGRDYGFEQVSFEDEGKSPSPARMKELIDIAREKEIKIIFIQAEYDVRNAQSLSRETGARLVVINPMNPEWPEAVMEVARAVGGSGQQFETVTEGQAQSRTRSVGTAVPVGCLQGGQAIGNRQ